MSRSKLVAQVPAAMARSNYLNAVVPRAAVGELDVLGAPYWGHANGKDAHGEYFTPDTDFQPELIPFPPVFYYHGAETGSSPTPIGRTLDRWDDNLGMWFRVALDMTQPEARRVWQAAQVGNAYASTGGVGASIIVDPTGEIRQWLIGELSLFDMDSSIGREPANRYAIALPRMKALLDGLPAAQRQLFDQVYQVASSDDTTTSDSGGRNVDVIEILQAIFARVIEELAAAMNVSPAAAAETVDEAVSGATDEAAAADTEPPMDAPMDETKCAGCKEAGCQGEGCAGCKGCGEPKKSEGEVEGAVAEILDALDLDATSMSKSKALKALLAQNASLRGQLAEREDSDWLKAQIAAFKIMPAEADATLKALTAARTADARSKAGALPTVAALKAMIEARPGKYARQDLPGKGLKLAGFQTDKQTQDKIDTEYMRRVRRLAGLPEGA